MARRGRQKVEMEKIKNYNNLHVTFTQRRLGLFKMANELGTLCGAEVALVVLSPGNRVHSFGQPDVRSLLDRYLSRNPNPAPPPSGSMQRIQTDRNATIGELNMELIQVMDQLDVERKRGQELKKKRKETSQQRWWEGPVDGMNKAQLEELKAALLELKLNLIMQAKNLLQQATPPQQLMRENSNAAGMPMPMALEQLPFNGNNNFDNNLDGMFSPVNMMMMPHGFDNTNGFGPGAAGTFY